jgi:hypothetical protein
VKSGRLLLLASATAVTACLDLSSPGAGVLSVAQFRLPYPAVVAGDTLRDTLGRAVPLSIVALDARGDTVADPDASFFVSSSAVIVTPQGFLLGVSPGESPVRVVAQVGGLQVENRVDVVPRPTDAIRVTPAEIAPLEYTPGSGQTALLRSPELSLRVEAGSGAASEPVRSWIVRYEITRAPQGVPGAEGVAFLGNESGVPTAVDTTNASGVASRRVLVRQALLPGLAGDTVEVRAAVTERGTHVEGSPVIFRIPIVSR